jgi:hypothetical protein
VEHVTRSSVHRGAADLQISGAARCGNRAIAVQAGWKKVEAREVVTNTLRRAWSGKSGERDVVVRLWRRCQSAEK